MSDQEDLHRPTAAGPEPGAVSVDAAAEAPVTEPTPVVGASEATHEHPAGTAAASGPAGLLDDPAHPEKAVGAAFAGGLVAAMFLKALARRRHR